MIEKTITLKLPPGVYRNGTRYQAKNRWYDANGVRWTEGLMGPIGGWRTVSTQADHGTATAGGATTLTDSTKTWVIDEHAGKTLRIVGGTGSGQSKTIASNTATILTVSAWGVQPDNTSVYVIDGATLQVTGKPRAMYGYRASDAVSHGVIGTHSKIFLYTDGVLEDTTPSDFPTGSAVDDFVDGVFVAGNFGDGPFGSGYYGTGSGALTLVAPGTWTIDNFGDKYVACHTVDGRLLVGDDGGGDMVEVDATAPTSNTAVVVTPEHFIVALGADGDARLVKWPDFESLTDWEVVEGSQANEFPLPTKGRLVCGRRTRRQTILWTDVDVYAMTFQGGVDVYAFEQLGDNCGIVGPQACTVLGDRMFWMSYGKFFEYDGALKPIPCDITDEVFDSLDQSQRAKVQCIPMTLFNEVWWTYPSKGRASYENDKYVAYNFAEGFWMMGDLDRSAGIDRGVYEYPVMLDPSGFMYEHEFGADRTGMSVFAETGPIEIGEGENLMRVQRIIPDDRVLPDDQTLGAIEMTLFGAAQATGVERSVGPFTPSEVQPCRITARQVRLRVDELLATNWRVGIPKLGVIPVGRR